MKDIKALVSTIGALYEKAIEGMPARWKSHCILPSEHATRLHTIQDDENPPCYIIADGLYERHGQWLVAIHNAWPELKAALAPLAEPVVVPGVDDMITRLRRNPAGVAFDTERKCADMLEALRAELARVLAAHKGLMAEADRRLDEATARAEASERALAEINRLRRHPGHPSWDEPGSALDAAGRDGE